VTRYVFKFYEIRFLVAHVALSIFFIYDTYFVFCNDKIKFYTNFVIKIKVGKNKFNIT